MDGGTEIRKLPVASTYNLMQYLESSSLWKDLMSKIPKNLDINDGLLKYNSEHISLIEDAAIKQKRLCSEILFEEWGTSGRRRPTIEDLLQLLIKMEMYRAADIVSIEILKGSAVKRPHTGPAAKIDISMTNILLNNPINNTEIEELLNNMPYPSTVTIKSTDVFNKNINKASDLNTPKVSYKYPLVFTSVSDTTHNSDDIHSDDILMNERAISDLMKFSKSNNDLEAFNNNAIIPSLSTLLVGEHLDENCTPALALSPSFSTLLNNSNYVESSQDLNYDSQSTEELSESDVDDVTKDLPNLSIMLQNDSSNGQKISGSDSGLIPMLSALQSKPEMGMHNSENYPNISLSTNLPHIKYSDIKISTCNFSDLSDPPNLRGGKIGSGGFGVVYLAYNLLSEPVAVKRLSFQSNSKKYNELILKQFKAEVEVLSNYSHTNIVSLLGYSCDGPANCLIYEYVNGGSLREQLDKGGLPWQERHQIALRTCFGIEYLHTGNSTPLIHRDIKSTNIMLTASGIPKLCDFGLAKFLLNQNNTTTIIGTSAYMAPEAFRGDISLKMDVFSFGVVLLELITGLPPIVEDRNGIDLFTHVMDVCADDKVERLLDKTAGTCNHSEKLFILAKLCLDEKKKRPEISLVRKQLQEISML